MGGMMKQDREDEWTRFVAAEVWAEGPACRMPTRARKALSANGLDAQLSKHSRTMKYDI